MENSTKGAFGEHLKREREMRGVSLDEIAAATRIAPRFLQAIENEQWGQLPGGIFTKGFVRSMAHYLGLDEEDIVGEYALAIGDQPAVPVWTGSPPAVAPDRRWIAWAVTAIIAAGLIAGGWFAARHISAWRASRSSSRAAASAVLAPEAVASGPVASEPAASGSGATHGADTTAVPADSSTSAPDSSTLPPAPPATLAGEQTPTATEPAATASSPFKLKIEAGSATRIKVKTDGQRAFGGSMKAGESRTFTAQNRFQVSARNAGVLLLELNGETLAPIGPPGRSGEITLTRENLKKAAGGNN